MMDARDIKEGQRVDVWVDKIQNQHAKAQVIVVIDHDLTPVPEAESRVPCLFHLIMWLFNPHPFQKMQPSLKMKDLFASFRYQKMTLMSRLLPPDVMQQAVR